MSQQKRQLKNQIGLVGAICGSLLLSLPALAQTPANPDRPAGTQSNMMCSPNTSETNMNREGTTSANSNRDTPSTEIDRSTMMSGRPSTTNTDMERQRSEGTTSANSNRDTPTTEIDRPTMMSGRPSTTNTSLPSDPMSARDPDAVRMGEQAACDSGNNTDMNRNTPSSTPPNRDKQMRRDNYQMMQPRPNSRIIPPTPEQRQGASARVRTTNGRVNVRLVNDTGANVVYEVIGDTNQRTLQGESYISLEALDTPTTITFYRQDGGLLRVRSQAVAPGMLEVRFAATTDLGADKNALTIQPTGGVYLN
ncbi:hypothetical protein [Argonema antarcticum]|uniref:hypothetical protein n=1 Tax=Argonema antarcticum TaxID=2942763 RepID=UPI002011EE89|nr:hypothetical protein [Argonema antarcticum]MCL1475784.1 hypothetical protein [Argonema antarcticum A004/B2]